MEKQRAFHFRWVIMLALQLSLLTTFVSAQSLGRSESDGNHSTKYEAGIAIGIPALVQPRIGLYTKNNLGWHLSGMVTPNVKGVQGNLLFRLTESRAFMWNIGVAGGYSEITYDARETWTYGALTTSINLLGVFLEAGLSWGRGDFNNPQLIGQIGYVHRFRR